jgi:hypothetical protein
VDFGDERHASIVKNSLSVDDELNIETVNKEISINGFFKK